MALFGTEWHVLRGLPSQNPNSRNELRQITKWAGTLAPAGRRNRPWRHLLDAKTIPKRVAWDGMPLPAPNAIPRHDSQRRTLSVVALAYSLSAVSIVRIVCIVRSPRCNLRPRSMGSFAHFGCSPPPVGLLICAGRRFNPTHYYNRLFHHSRCKLKLIRLSRFPRLSPSLAAVCGSSHGDPQAGKKG